MSGRSRHEEALQGYSTEGIMERPNVLAYDFASLRAWLEIQLKSNEQAVSEELLRRSKKLLRDFESLSLTNSGVPAAEISAIEGVCLASQWNSACEALKDNTNLPDLSNTVCIDGASNTELADNVTPSAAKKEGEVLEMERELRPEKSWVADPSIALRAQRQGNIHFLTIANHRMFELVSFVIILLNVALIAAEHQCEGWTLGHDLGLYSTTSKEGWPSSVKFFEIADIIINIYFVCEVSLRITAVVCEHRTTQLSTMNWVIFDTVLVLWDLVTRVFHSNLGLRPHMFRLLRLLRLLRLVRLFSSFHAFDSLFLLMRSLRASVSALFWSLAFLLLMHMLVSILMGIILDSYIRDASKPLADRVQVFRLYGTFTRGLLTNFEISLANWSPVCRFLMENVSEWFFLFFLFFSCTLCFALVRVISAVFIAESNRVLQHDEDVQVRFKKNMQEKHRRQFGRLFTDSAGNIITGLSKNALIKALSTEDMQARLASLDITAYDLDALFDILDDIDETNGEGVVEKHDFIKGMCLLKGQARSLDVMYLRKQISQMMEFMPTLLQCLQDVQKACSCDARKQNALQ